MEKHVTGWVLLLDENSLRSILVSEPTGGFTAIAIAMAMAEKQKIEISKNLGNCGGSAC